MRSSDRYSNFNFDARFCALAPEFRKLEDFICIGQLEDKVKLLYVPTLLMGKVCRPRYLKK